MAAAVTNDATAKLLDMMSYKADVELVFDEAQPGDKQGILLAHSQILAVHSSVIRIALDIEDANKGRESGKPRRILMPGSLRADFLKVAPFMYPVLPLPEVSWDNLETLLIQGSKWDMAVMLAQAADFIQVNATILDSNPDWQQYAFRLLQLADAAGAEAAVTVCVDRIDPSMCTEDRLQRLSPGTLRQLVVRMASKACATRVTCRKSR